VTDLATRGTKACKSIAATGTLVFETGIIFFEKGTLVFEKGISKTETGISGSDLANSVIAAGTPGHEGRWHRTIPTCHRSPLGVIVGRGGGHRSFRATIGGTGDRCHRAGTDGTSEKMGGFDNRVQHPLGLRPIQSFSPNGRERYCIVVAERLVQGGKLLVRQYV
jgi:hypothetical protein